MRRKVAFLLIFLLLLIPINSAMLLVDLSLEPSAKIVEAGNVFSLQLWARSALVQEFYGMDVLLQWNPSHFTFLGKTDEYAWMAAFFPAGSGLNDTWIDGDAHYTALALSPLPTTDLLVTSFRFQPLKFGESTISLPVWRGGYHTIIAGHGGVNILGTTAGAAVEVVPEPGTILLLGFGLLFGLYCVLKKAIKK